MREQDYDLERLEKYSIMKAANMGAAIAASGLLTGEELYGQRENRYRREVHPTNKPKAKNRDAVKAKRKQNRRRK